MSSQDSLNLLQQKIIEFQDIVKKQVFLLSKFDIQVINLNNKTEPIKLSLALYFLRNIINGILKSKIRINDFEKLQRNIKRLFQKFIDAPELIEFDKGENLFKKLNENNTISCFNFLFCDDFQEKINKSIFKENCYQLKESLTNFDKFKERFNEISSKFEKLNILRKKVEEFQKLLDIGDLKKLNEKNLEDFRLFRSLLPLDDYSDYLIDIQNKKIFKKSE
ncbi:MAG TPA: hypothetical protein VGB37_12030 [Candidatus Lokiarchaeia archaeon]